MANFATSRKLNILLYEKQKKKATWKSGRFLTEKISVIVLFALADW
jgi:hypothetical protein